MDNKQEKTKIKFVCISDTHSKHYKLKLPKGDVLLHAGDFSMTGQPQEVSQFNDFLKNAPFEQKIVIAGNHDLTFDLEQYDKSLKNRFHKNQQYDAKATKSLLKDCIYLEDSSYNLKGINIYGSPYTPTFFNWGFNLDIGEPLQKIWNKIPLNTDILITHGPPYDIGDKTFDGIKAGCPDLRKIILEKVKPKYHIFGHIHEAAGEYKVENTTFINACSLNAYYHPQKIEAYSFEYEI